MMPLHISKRHLYLGAAAVAVLSFLATPAHAQYYTLKSKQPQVEVNLDRLSPDEAGPAARPLWQPKPAAPAPAPAAVPAEETERIILRQPLKMPPEMAAPLPPPAETPAAVPAAEPARQAISQPPAPSAAPAAIAPPARLSTPLFAAPVVPPADSEELPPQEISAAAMDDQTENSIPDDIAPPALPAAAKPAPVADVAPPALTPAKLMAPILEPEANKPATAKPAKKPEVAAQPAPDADADADADIDLPLRKPASAKQEMAAAAEPVQPAPQAPVTTPVAKPAADNKTIMSYPPAQQPAAPVQRFERPVLPQGMSDYAAPAAQATAPAPKPVTHLPPQPTTDIKLDGILIPADIQEEPEDTLPAAALAADEAGQDLPPTVLSADELDSTPAAEAQAGAETPAMPARRPSLVITHEPPPAKPAAPAPKAAAAPQPAPTREIVVPTLADLSLEFDGTSSELNDTTRQKLTNLLPLLKEDESRRLAVHAYASGEDGSKSSARRISLSRALAVRAYLMDNGIKPTRVDVRALGLETDRKPLERVDLVFAR